MRPSLLASPFQEKKKKKPGTNGNLRSVLSGWQASYRQDNPLNHKKTIKQMSDSPAPLRKYKRGIQAPLKIKNSEIRNVYPHLKNKLYILCLAKGDKASKWKQQRTRGREKRKEREKEKEYKRYYSAKNRHRWKIVLDLEI